ncbi:MAG TPA: transaldolase [Longimicrobiales bacterium]|nr:transaldolase [Longimicrobiales bacterium]
MGALSGFGIDIYSDGANVQDMVSAYRSREVDGFTTNPTLMAKAGVPDYRAFARDVLETIRDLPVCFEVFEDGFEAMGRQAREIASWGENVFVKVPITNTRGESSVPLIRELTAEGLRLNVTAVLAPSQGRAVIDAVNPDVPAILSIFAGRIADTGRDPMPLMREAVELAKRRPLLKVLWASPREVLNIYQAEACGCHIIAVTPDLRAKLHLRGKDLEAFSRETVQMFYDDAARAGYTL